MVSKIYKGASKPSWEIQLKYKFSLVEEVLKSMHIFLIYICHAFFGYSMCSSAILRIQSD